MKTSTKTDSKTVYLVISANRLGVQCVFLTSDRDKLDAKVKEEIAKGRRCRVVDHAIYAETD